MGLTSPAPGHGPHTAGLQDLDFTYPSSRLWASLLWAPNNEPHFFWLGLGTSTLRILGYGPHLSRQQALNYCPNISGIRVILWTSPLRAWAMSVKSLDSGLWTSPLRALSHTSVCSRLRASSLWDLGYSVSIHPGFAPLVTTTDGRHCTPVEAFPLGMA